MILQQLHTNYIIHRDIKPENLVLGRVGTKEANRVHLIDFGLSERLTGGRHKLLVLGPIYLIIFPLQYDKLND